MVEFYKKKLGNGLTILFEKRKQDVVSISASVKQGSAYEPINRKGISHFIEHLMFKGTETRSYKEIGEEIEKKGGVINAFTGEEVTSCWTKLPNKHFFTGANLVRDLILNPKFNPQEFEKEKKVVVEEIKMYHDNPHLYVLDKIKSLLYKKPFGLSALGNEKSVLNLGREDVLNFFSRKYTANKMILCVVGNSNLEDIEKEGRKFPKTKAKVEKAKIVRIHKQMIEKRRGLGQAHLALGLHFDSKNRYPYEIFNTFLACGMSSKLFEEIREKRGLAYDVKGYLEIGKNYGYQIIYTGTTKKNVKLCKEIILKEIKNMKNFENKDLEQVKEQLIGLRKVESEESVNVMNALVNEEVDEKAENFYNYDNKIGKVKLKEVRKLAKIKGFSSLVLLPKS